MASSADPNSHDYKVVLIGSIAVGKTAIATRLQFKIFDEDYQPTVGAGYIPYKTAYKGKDIELQIWDTAGMERYKSLGSIYYRDSNAAVIVFDQTSKESAEAIEKWLESFRTTVKGECYIAVAANKDDLPDKCVPLETIKKWCEDRGFGFFITSARTGLGVQEMFNSIIEHIASDKSLETTKVPQLRKIGEKKEKSCC